MLRLRATPRFEIGFRAGKAHSRTGGIVGRQAVFCIHNALSMKLSRFFKPSRWRTTLVNGNERRKSELCKAKDFRADWYKRWCGEMQETPRYHRKQWEHAYVLQALWERQCIEKGKRGLVFAVGTEPLPSVLANHGCEVLATDIFVEEGIKKGWTNNAQLCFGVDSLYKKKIVDEQLFRSLVSYRPVDMNAIPDELTGFDFNWSSCSFEHLGSLQKGLAFLKNQIDTLKPGGWAVHTTEFNISSNDRTMDTGNTVIFRMQDIDRTIAEIRAMGHCVEELDYSLGGLPQDFKVDLQPYKLKTHVKLQLDQYVVTSIGLIIQRQPTV